MPHARSRFILEHFKKLNSFWPIVGLLGLRQVGKSYFLRELAGFQNNVTFDDDDVREEAEASAKVFLSKQTPPFVIDEIQKVPKVFDALKSAVDKKKRPGQWIVTGSISFQNLSSIRESLTGRIGLVRLHPMSLAEINQLDYQPLQGPFGDSKRTSCRLDISTFAAQMGLGGLPVPSFIRDQKNRKLYFDSWFDTLLARDGARIHGPSYEFDQATRLLKTMGEVLRQGRHPQLNDFKLEPRRLKKYLKTFETLFLIRKFSVDERGVGKDFWLPTDSGMAHHMMGYSMGPEVNLTLARVFLLNEIISNYEYQGEKISLPYFKSQHGSIIDFVWNGIPIKIISENPQKTGWIEKPLLGAMKAFKSDQGIIVAPGDQIHLEKKGISIVPWSYWS